MFRVVMSEDFSAWLDGIADPKEQARIAQQLMRLGAGLFDDVEMCDNGMHRLKFFHPSGYQIKFCIENDQIVMI